MATLAEQGVKLCRVCNRVLWAKDADICVECLIADIAADEKPEVVTIEGERLHAPRPRKADSE